MKSKTNNLIITSLIFIAIGLVFVLTPVDTLLWLTFVLLGILIIICNIPTLIEDISNLKTEGKNIPGFIFTILCIILGFILIFWHNKVLLYIFGAYLIVFPTIRILLSKEKKKQLSLELPKLILGVISIILGPENTMNVIFKIIGIIFILAGLTYLICTILLITKYKENIDSNNDC